MILAAQFFIDEAWVRGCGGNSGESRRRREKSVSKVSKKFHIVPNEGDKPASCSHKRTPQSNDMSFGRVFDGTSFEEVQHFPADQQIAPVIRDGPAKSSIFVSIPQ